MKSIARGFIHRERFSLLHYLFKRLNRNDDMSSYFAGFGRAERWYFLPQSTRMPLAFSVDIYEKERTSRLSVSQENIIDVNSPMSQTMSEHSHHDIISLFLPYDIY